MRDIAAEASDIAENTEADDDQLNATQERLNLLYRLQKKHGVENNTELISLRDGFKAKLQQFEKVMKQLLPLKKKSMPCKKDMVAKSNRNQRGKEKKPFRVSRKRSTIYFSSSCHAQCAPQSADERTAGLCSHGKR